MNEDKIKGALQKVGGHIEEAAGALVGDENLKLAGQEDQVKGDAREAWGNVKEAGDALIDRAKAAKIDAEMKSEKAQAFDREHAVEVAVPKSAADGPTSKSDIKKQAEPENDPGPMSKAAPPTMPDGKDAQGKKKEVGPESKPIPTNETA